MPAEPASERFPVRNLHPTAATSDPSHEPDLRWLLVSQVDAAGSIAWCKARHVGVFFEVILSSLRGDPVAVTRPLLHFR
jgi:hypothetical protein